MSIVSTPKKNYPPNERASLVHDFIHANKTPTNGRRRELSDVDWDQAGRAANTDSAQGATDVHQIQIPIRPCLHEAPNKKHNASDDKRYPTPVALRER